jgi:predicted nucleic acid-binding Zn ribbon protein
MPILYVYRCRTCLKVTEVEKPYGVFDVPAPLCPNGHGLMMREFTPVDVRVKGGTPLFHGKRGDFDKGKHAEDFKEQQIQDANLETECANLKEESKRNYYGNGLHHAHGFGSPEDDMSASKELKAQEAKKCAS